MTQNFILDPRTDDASDLGAEDSLTDDRFVNTNDLAVPEEDESEEYNAL